MIKMEALLLRSLATESRPRKNLLTWGEGSDARREGKK